MDNQAQLQQLADWMRAGIALVAEDDHTFNPALSLDERGYICAACAKGTLFVGAHPESMMMSNTFSLYGHWTLEELPSPTAPDPLGSEFPVHVTPAIVVLYEAMKWSREQILAWLEEVSGLPPAV